MNSSIVPFQFDNMQVRVFNIDDEPLFVGRDVAAALGYSDVTQAVRKNCKKAKSLIDIGVSSRHPEWNQGLTDIDPQTKLIPESDVYRLTLRSHLPSAERFQDWIVEEVLPEIRKTGGYGSSDQELVKNHAEEYAAVAFFSAAVTGLYAIDNVPEHLRNEARNATLARFGRDPYQILDRRELIRAAQSPFASSRNRPSLHDQQRLIDEQDRVRRQRQKAAQEAAQAILNDGYDNAGRADVVADAMTPTAMAALLGTPRTEINPLLCRAGLQDRRYPSNGGIVYALTKKGAEHGFYLGQRGRIMRDNRFVKQLLWSSSVLDRTDVPFDTLPRVGPSYLDVM